MKRILVLAALVAAFLMPLAVMAEEGTTTETTAETTTEASGEESGKVLYPVTVISLADEGKVIEDLSKVYELKSVLGAEKAVKYHLEHVIKPSAYMVAETIIGAPYVEMDAAEAVIYVIPKKKTVQVIHHLYSCDGKVRHSFLERLEVPYLTKLSQEAAPELLTAQIEAVSGRGYTLKDIEVKDYVPVPYKIFDADGKEVTPEPELPTIQLYYLDKACKDEEPTKTVSVVPTTTVQGGDAPIGRLPAYGETLPATGDRTVMGFMLGAALLAVGVVLKKAR